MQCLFDDPCFVFASRTPGACWTRDRQDPCGSDRSCGSYGVLCRTSPVRELGQLGHYAPEGEIEAISQGVAIEGEALKALQGGSGGRSPLRRLGFFFGLLVLIKF
jgi:hypothetical protein